MNHIIPCQTDIYIVINFREALNLKLEETYFLNYEEFYSCIASRAF